MNLTEMQNKLLAAKVVARRQLKRETAEQAATNRAAWVAMLTTAGQRADNHKKA